MEFKTGDDQGGQQESFFLQHLSMVLCSSCEIIQGQNNAYLRLQAFSGVDRRFTDSLCHVTSIW